MLIAGLKAAELPGGLSLWALGVEHGIELWQNDSLVVQHQCS